MPLVEFFPEDHRSGNDCSARQAVFFAVAMRTVVLPFWAVRGLDPRSGLFWECFGFDGLPLQRLPYRLMVQARQTATFVEAARRGHGAPDAALQSFDRSLTLFSEGGDLSRGLAFSVDANGRVIDHTRDAYTHAFALFALAKVLRASGESRHRAAIETLLAFVDATFVDPRVGGLRDRWPDPSPGKAQNPTMHLLEAYLALHEAWPERGFIARAGALVALAESRLARDPPGVIREHYGPDWQPATDAPDGLFFEPGHQFEWAWLLDRYGRLAGEPTRPLAGRLWEAAAREGFDDSGYCIDAVGLDGVPSRPSRRLWPHCEAVRAALVHPRRGDADVQAVLSAVLERLNADFLGAPFAAGWIDRRDRHGGPGVDVVPASSLYHLYGAFEEIEDRCLRDSSVGLDREAACPD